MAPSMDTRSRDVFYRAPSAASMTPGACSGSARLPPQGHPFIREIVDDGSLLGYALGRFVSSSMARGHDKCSNLQVTPGEPRNAETMAMPPFAWKVGITARAPTLEQGFEHRLVARPH